MDYVVSLPTARARKPIAKMALTVANCIGKLTSRLRYGRLIDFRNKDKNPIVKMTPSVAGCTMKIVLSDEAGFMPDYVKKRFYPRLKVVVIEKLCYLEPHLEEMYTRYPHSIHCLVTIALGVPWRTIQVTNEVLVKAIKRATDKLTTNTIPSEKNRGFEVLCQADITLFLRTIGPNTIGTSLYARRVSCRHRALPTQVKELTIIIAYSMESRHERDCGTADPLQLEGAARLVVRNTISKDIWWNLVHAHTNRASCGQNSIHLFTLYCHILFRS